MKIDEAWEQFRSHMGLPDHSVPCACFYAGYVAGADEVQRAAAEASHQAKTKFAEKLMVEQSAEGNGKAEGKPS